MAKTYCYRDQTFYKLFVKALNFRGTQFGKPCSSRPCKIPNLLATVCPFFEIRWSNNWAAWIGARHRSAGKPNNTRKVYWHLGFIKKRRKGLSAKLPNRSDGTADTSCVVARLWVFFGHRSKCFWNDRKKLSHFGQNVWKYKLMNIVAASFHTTVRQMTEMSRWPKFLSEKQADPDHTSHPLDWSNERRGECIGPRTRCSQSGTIFHVWLSFRLRGIPTPWLSALHVWCVQSEPETECDWQLELCQTSPLRARMDLEILMAKGHSSFPKIVEFTNCRLIICWRWGSCSRLPNLVINIVGF